MPSVKPSEMSVKVEDQMRKTEQHQSPQRLNTRWRDEINSEITEEVKQMTDSEESLDEFEKTLLQLEKLKNQKRQPTKAFVQSPLVLK
jgi:hypothetical protein